MEYKTQNQISEQLCKQMFEELFRILGYRAMFLNEGLLFDVFTCTKSLMMEWQNYHQLK